MQTKKDHNWELAPQIELTYKSNPENAGKFTVTKPEDAYKFFLNNWNMGTLELQEEFKVLLLSGTKVLGIYKVASGRMDAVDIDIRLVFTAALQIKATDIILAHNHPSGTLKPTTADKLVTKRFKHAASLMHINLADHLIITKVGFFSFGVNGIL